jgi:hypothetical protein
MFSCLRKRASRPVAGRGFVPRVEQVENRVVPSASPFHWFPPVHSGPAASLEVRLPAQTTAGHAVLAEVIALTVSNHRAFSFTGTVQIADNDAAAVVPKTITFHRGDHGVRYFWFTPETAGTETITATSSKTATITGSDSMTVKAAPAATQFLVRAQEQTTVGALTNVTITALDASGHRVWNYAGTVHVTSSDTAAQLPSDYTFTPQDHGTHTFTVTLGTIGAQTVKATDTVTGAITGSATTTVSAAAVATHFRVLASPFVVSGQTSNVTVIPLDASGHRVKTYTGTVTFTSTDSSATLPSSYQFTVNDRGIHVFQVKLTTQGQQTLTVTDNITPALTGTHAVFVSSFRQFGGFFARK